MTTFAGHDDSLSQDCFCADGTGAATEFINPVAIATDSVGDVYAADSLNNTIRKITAAAVVTTLQRSGVVVHITSSRRRSTCPPSRLLLLLLGLLGPPLALPSQWIRPR